MHDLRMSLRNTVSSSRWNAAKSMARGLLYWLHNNPLWSLP